MTVVALYPSSLLRIVASVVLLLTIWALILLPVSVWLRLSLTVLLLAQAYPSWLAGLARSRVQGTECLLLRLEAGAVGVGDGHEWQQYYPPKPLFLGEWLIILDLSPMPVLSRQARRFLSGWSVKRRRLVLAADSMSAEDHWLLRRYLHDHKHV